MSLLILYFSAIYMLLWILNVTFLIVSTYIKGVYKTGILIQPITCNHCIKAYLTWMSCVACSHPDIL